MEELVLAKGRFSFTAKTTIVAEDRYFKMKWLKVFLHSSFPLFK